MTKVKLKYIDLIVIFILCAAFLFTTFPVWKALVESWNNSEDYSHGYLVVPISIYLIWLKKDHLNFENIKGSIWGLVLVLISLFLLVFSHFAEIVTLRSLSVIPIIIGSVLYLFGTSILKELLFPISFLIFMIPLPSQIYSALTIPLQLLVSKISVSCAHLIGIPVLNEGNVIYLSDITLQVVSACSGIRSMITLLMLSALLGYIGFKKLWLKIVFFLSGIPVAIFVNIIRVLLIIVFLHFFSVDLTEGHYHQVLGLSIFFISLVVLLVIRKALLIWD